VADLGEVGLVEQRHLQRPVVGGHRGDRPGPQRGHPAHPAELAQSLDPGAGDHPLVPDHHHLLQPEGVAYLLDDAGERGRVGGVAGDNLDRDRTPGRVGQQPVLDLRQGLLAVAGVTAGGQRAASPGHPGGGQVEQRQQVRVRGRVQMPSRQGLIDGVLAPDQPVHRRVHLVGGRPCHTQIARQGGVGPPRGGGQFRAGPSVVSGCVRLCPPLAGVPLARGPLRTWWQVKDSNLRNFTMDLQTLSGKAVTRRKCPFPQ